MALVRPVASLPILYVDHAEALGGAENILLLLLGQLDRGRFSPHLATQPGRLADQARARRVIVHEMPLPRLRGVLRAPGRLARGVAALTRIVRRERVAVICSNSARASLYAAVAARLTHRPLLWHVHEVLASGVYTRLMCALSDVAIAVSAAVAARLPCTPKVRVIHNGVRPEDFGDRPEHAGRLRATWGVPPGAVLVGHVARLQPWKGQRDVVAAAALLLQQLPDTYFAVIGGDIFGDAAAYEKELKAIVAQRGLSHRVILTGHQADMPAVFSAIDIVVHASRHEPFATVLLEAGAAGRPVVAYADGGVPEAIVHDETGVLVRPGDPAALAAALAGLVRNPERARALGAAARVRVCARFDIRRMACEVEEVLLHLVDGAAGQTSR